MMKVSEWRILLARLLGLGGLGCGIVGLVIGMVDRIWKLGVTGWFTGGILLALLAVILLLDEYTEFRRRRGYDTT